MEKFLQKWYNYCGVEVREVNILSAMPSVKLESDRYICLPFIMSVVIIVKIAGEYYFSKFNNGYNSDSLAHYTVYRSEIGYYIACDSNKVDLEPLDISCFDDILNPIPLDRRKQRDEVMRQYQGKKLFTLPHWQGY